jgi:hypothetical protein
MIKSRRKNAKPCKGYKDTAGYGCSKPITIHTSGLCDTCLNKWKIDQIKQGNTKVLSSITRKAKIEVNKVVKEKKKEQTQLKMEQKQAIKKKSEYLKELQTIVNRIVRIIDTGKGCVSCDHGWRDKWTRQQHAGHRLSVGSCPELRFNFLNIYLQCSICNNWKSGNEREYDKGLLKHYDRKQLEIVQNLRLKYPSLHITIEELKEAIKRGKGVEKEILSGKSYTRNELNNKLGIYED